LIFHHLHQILLANLCLKVLVHMGQIIHLHHHQLHLYILLLNYFLKFHLQFDLEKLAHLLLLHLL
jgi:hypothetical protein